MKTACFGSGRWVWKPSPIEHSIVTLLIVAVHRLDTCQTIAKSRKIIGLRVVFKYEREFNAAAKKAARRSVHHALMHMLEAHLLIGAAISRGKCA